MIGHKRQSFKFTLKFASGISHFLQQSYSRLRYAHPENFCQHPRIRIKWIKSLTLAEIGHWPSNTRTCLVKKDQAGSYMWVTVELVY